MDKRSGDFWRLPVEERVRLQTIEVDGCFVFTGQRTSEGYGRIRDGKRKMVHVAMYEKLVGPVPKGKQLDHYVCDNPSCWNPEHLKPVTPRENVLRSTSPAANNARKTHCIRNHELTGRWSNGKRYCKTCRADRARELRQRQKQTPAYA